MDDRSMRGPPMQPRASNEVRYVQLREKSGVIGEIRSVCRYGNVKYCSIFVEQ